MNDVTTETSNHTIQATSHGITITAKHLPTNAVSLNVGETNELLELLLVWHGGLTISPNDPDA